jgi:hypothetical protein
MKNFMILFAILLGLAACAPMAAVPTRTAVPASATPVPPTTNTAIPTETFTPNASPTPEASPTTVLPPYTPGLAKSFAQVEDVGSMENLNTIFDYLSSPTQMQHPVVSTIEKVNFGLKKLGQTFVVFQCNGGRRNTCAVLATARIGDHLYIIAQIATASGPANQLLYIGNSSSGGEQEAAQGYLDRLNDTNGFELNIYLQLNNLDLTNPYIYTMTAGPNDSLSEGALQLEKGLITDGQTLRWGQV